MDYKSEAEELQEQRDLLKKIIILLIICLNCAVSLIFYLNF